MIDNDALAEFLFPETHESIADLEAESPPRLLKEGAQVTRFAPSPTGFLHTGSLFTAMVSFLTARKSGGVYYVRLEDTDTKRTIQGSEKDLIEQLANFGIVPDEGFSLEGEKGAYGPYRQSDRRDIYKTVIKELVRMGRAYPDFCSAEDLARIRAEQEEKKILPGYYGIYARDRDLSNEERVARIKNGEPYVIRYRSNGDHEKKTKFFDVIRGEIELQDNDTDVVILKSDGLPTYHFAHVCDDHFMRTTIVTRGEEWISSTPIHLDLFRALGWRNPKYAHIPSIMKLDNGNRRKLSKRKDPEAAVSYFADLGYPKESLIVYLMSIANSNFEEWTIANKSFDIAKFPFSIKKMSLDGALFDQMKLNYFSKEVIVRKEVDVELEEIREYAKAHEERLVELIDRDEEYVKRILSIGRTGKNPRKDCAKYSEIYDLIGYFYRDIYDSLPNELPFREGIDKEKIKELLIDCANLPVGGDEQSWFEELKSIGAKHGFATSNKDYKADPTSYVGSVSDCAEILRVAIVGSNQSPNLHDILEIIGAEEARYRLGKVISRL